MISIFPQTVRSMQLLSHNLCLQLHHSVYHLAPPIKSPDTRSSDRWCENFAPSECGILRHSQGTLLFPTPPLATPTFDVLVVVFQDSVYLSRGKERQAL